MPPPGRKPKPAGQAVTRMPLNHDWVEVVDRPNPHPHKLPLKRANGKAWPSATKDWWRALASMPHTVLWRATDWMVALETAELSARFWAGEDARAATELRNRGKLLGLTFDDRRGLRLKYVPVETSGQSKDVRDDGVARLDDYRNL